MHFKHTHNNSGRKLFSTPFFRGRVLQGEQREIVTAVSFLSKCSGAAGLLEVRVSIMK